MAQVAASRRFAKASAFVAWLSSILLPASATRARVSSTGEILPEPAITEIRDILLDHMRNLYAFYGEHTGVLMARKHLSWYSKGQSGGALFRQTINAAASIEQQTALTHEFFDRLVEASAGAACAEMAA